MNNVKNLKTTLVASLGTLGLVLYHLLLVLLIFAPLLVLRLPLWLDAILIFILFLGFVGELLRLALYIWAICAISGASPAASIVFWISCVFYVLTTLLPFAFNLLGLFSTGDRKR